ncbi:nucleoside triphosphate hydrolase superfamily protein [Richelia sinica FACHB-800]|uniref:Nucleoside triphosphate hydrolase superfamily protein n=1 Tax=Richelia sinica FACHB-800 TaxID=1357546 RepID=A0A975T6J5_9NOST|nr:sulfotransferase domain-containing protein [Richelia sinica]MBD2666874.1 sulfotransferase domain-containing protein [Richelia sinica FACHB-800]QXE23059.1 nucleoside triphosphate hydrolase superfamily protein [Richelia sinica FACHB-800]
MENKLRSSLRNSKNNIIDKYYEYRIFGVKDPYQIRWRKNPYRAIFILSHMRSGSSLFTHILNSNPEIIGYGETHINYNDESDIKQLLFKVYGKLRQINMSHKYILDKVLHNHKILAENFLTSEKIYAIFLVREPKRTLASILNIKPNWSEEKALNYYIDRLLTLERYAKLINSKEHTLWLDYDQLVNQSNSVFVKLQNFLETKTAFSEEYEILHTTGIKGIGDSSENIKAGRIIKEQRKLEANISIEAIEKASHYFNECYTTLGQYCSSI